MTTRAVVALAAVGGAAVALLVAVLLPARTVHTQPEPARGIAVRAAFVPGTVEFGDTVTARIVVAMNARTVRPSSLHVVYSVAPLTQLGGATERHVTHGSSSIATYEVRASCLSEACVAASGRRAVAPRLVRADVARRDGTRASATAAWTPLVVSGRVSPADLSAAQPPFRADTVPPAPTYRVRPDLLAALLTGCAVLLAAAAAALVASALMRARAPRREADRDELTHALLLARAARSRPERDRRTAAGYLARLLARRDVPLATSADDLAWSRPAPSPDSLTELVEGVERERSS